MKTYEAPLMEHLNTIKRLSLAYDATLHAPEVFNYSLFDKLMTIAIVGLAKSEDYPFCQMNNGDHCFIVSTVNDDKYQIPLYFPYGSNFKDIDATIQSLFPIELSYKCKQQSTEKVSYGHWVVSNKAKFHISINDEKK